MKQHHHHKEPTVRFSIDLPAEKHAYLKKVAAKKGISMRQYVIESVYGKSDEDNSRVSDAKFKKAMGKVIKENDDVLKRLASK